MGDERSEMGVGCVYLIPHTGHWAAKLFGERGVAVRFCVCMYKLGGRREGNNLGCCLYAHFI